MKTLQNLLIVAVFIFCGTSAEAKSRILEVAEAIPGTSETLLALIDVATLKPIRFQTVGYRELDDFTFYVAQLRAKSSLLAAMVEGVAAKVADPELDREYFDSIGKEITEYSETTNANIAKLIESGRKLGESVDDYCARRPWRCHQVIRQLKHNIGELSAIESDVRVSLESVRELLVARDEEWSPPASTVSR